MHSKEDGVAEVALTELFLSPLASDGRYPSSRDLARIKKGWVSYSLGINAHIVYGVSQNSFPSGSLNMA